MSKKAFTLIEVLGAILILSVALVPVIGLIQSMLVISQKQEWETKSLFYAEQKMEEEIQLLRGDFSRSASATATIEGNYIFTAQYAQDGSIPLADLKVVTVTVWNDEDGSGAPPDSDETQVTLDTKIAFR